MPICLLCACKPSWYAVTPRCLICCHFKAARSPEDSQPNSEPSAMMASGCSMYFSIILSLHALQWVFSFGTRIINIKKVSHHTKFQHSIQQSNSQQEINKPTMSQQSRFSLFIGNTCIIEVSSRSFIFYMFLRGELLNVQFLRNQMFIVYQRCKVPNLISSTWVIEIFFTSLHAALSWFQLYLFVPSARCLPMS